MRVSRHFLAIATGVLTMLAASPARAQNGEAAVKRPKMEADRDTNSATAYYYWGLRTMAQDPVKASNAFYWASRLAPGWAEPLYARRVAAYLQKMDDLNGYLRAARSTKRTPEQRALDSLQYRALLLNPFLYEGLDGELRDKFLDKAFQDDPETRMQVAVASHRRTGDASYNAWLAYIETNFPEALKWNAQAIKRWPKEYDLHSERAKLFYLTANYDSTAAELGKALEGLRARDQKELVVVYESKAMYEYRTAHAYIAKGDLAAAREALGRALGEDLSFYMAHAALADIALTQGDTATAMTEFDMAVQLNGTDAMLRERYGMALVATKKYQAAAEQFWQEALNEPYYAAPHYFLAVLYDQSGHGEEASDFYSQYLDRAPKSETDRVAQANTRISAIAAATRAASAATPAGTAATTASAAPTTTASATPGTTASATPAVTKSASPAGAPKP